MDSHGCFESWFHNDRCIEMTFNVYDGRQVAKVQTVTSHRGPINCDVDTYEAMVARMRERENTRRD